MQDMTPDKARGRSPGDSVLDPGSASVASLRVIARRYCQNGDEADDLLQDALLAAYRAGRTDPGHPQNLRWLRGVLKKLAAMSVRGSVRRRLREQRWSSESASASPAPADPVADESFSSLKRHPVLEALPSSLREVALLALSGHNRAEVAWILDLSDTALRKRISDLRKRLASFEVELSQYPVSGRAGTGLLFGVIRRALLPVVVASRSIGSHDPDGHLILFSGGRRGSRECMDVGEETSAHIPGARGNRITEPVLGSRLHGDPSFVPLYASGLESIPVHAEPVSPETSS